MNYADEAYAGCRPVNEGRGPYVELASGTKWYINDPRADEVHVVDIAAALSKVCRFGGHVRHFYSVAQHCVMAAWMARDAGLNERERLTVLMHDASEAYLVDVPKPIKMLLPEYKRLELMTEVAVAEAFNLIFPFPAWVKEIDSRMLNTEQRDLMPEGHAPYYPGLAPYPFTLNERTCWVPEQAEANFRTEFWRLTA